MVLKHCLVKYELAQAKTVPVCANYQSAQAIQTFSLTSVDRAIEITKVELRRLQLQLLQSRN